MLAFGHPGITLGIAVLLAGASKRCRPSAHNGPPGGGHLSEQARSSISHLGRVTDWLDCLARRVDIRLLLLGSLLPDLIDKPVGQLFFRQTFSNGRIFAHSLVFLLLISVIGWFLYRRAKRTWLLALAFGTATHLVFDEMWHSLHTLLWPAYGFAFARGNLDNWMPSMLRSLVANPLEFTLEALGAVILAWFAVGLVRRKTVLTFVRYGVVSRQVSTGKGPRRMV